MVTSCQTWKDMIETTLNISLGILGDDALTKVALHIKEWEYFTLQETVKMTVSISLTLNILYKVCLHPHTISLAKVWAWKIKTLIMFFKSFTVCENLKISIQKVYSDNYLVFPTKESWDCWKH